MEAPGKVAIVGAGPGDPELLTIKALNAISSAEVVVYDRLVSEEILALAPAGVTRIDVGKEPGMHPVPQEEINGILVRQARAGRRVVRLKGGDPFIFGRGGEEAQELRRNGIPFEVVPGITAAQACAASLRTPLTQRGVAMGVRYVTGHCRENGELDLDWQGLGDPETTLVIYMGVANIGVICERLIAAGRSPTTPAIAVNNGARPDERRLVSHLGRLAAELADARFAGPVLFIIGEVAALYEEPALA